VVAKQSLTSRKWGKEKSQRRWVKAHIAVGVKSNIVTAVKVTPSTVHDSQVLPGLLARTVQRFDIAQEEVTVGKFATLRAWFARLWPRTWSGPWSIPAAGGPLHLQAEGLCPGAVREE
jgi:hypothetical protein